MLKVLKARGCFYLFSYTINYNIFLTKSQVFSLLMSTYLYIRAVPLITKGYHRWCQGLFKLIKGLCLHMYIQVRPNYTPLIPNCYFFVCRRVPLITPEPQRPPRPLSYPQVLPMLSTGRARFHVEHKLSTGYTQGKCEDALGYLWHRYCMTQAHTTWHRNCIGMTHVNSWHAYCYACAHD